MFGATQHQVKLIQNIIVKHMNKITSADILNGVPRQILKYQKMSKSPNV